MNLTQLLGHASGKRMFLQKDLMMTVGAVLSQKGCSVISVLPDSSVAAAAEIITRRRIGAVVVCDPAGRLLGILSERDVVRGLTLHGATLPDLPVSALTTRDIQLVTTGTPAHEAIEVMEAAYFRHLPVVRDGVLCGIVSIRDLARYLIKIQAGDAEPLQSYGAGRKQAGGRI